LTKFTAVSAMVVLEVSVHVKSRIAP
jgi:hypothetical protein